MQRVSIDIPIFSNDARYCNVSGELNVMDIPRVGENIRFNLSEEYWDLFDNDRCVASVTKQLVVEHKTLLVGKNEQSVLILLSDIFVTSFDDAKRITQYFERAYGLAGDFDD